MRVEVKTDDSSDKVVAESLDQAIKKIKEQIEVVQKETKPSDQQKIRVKALENAIRQLENTRRKTKTLDTGRGEKGRSQASYRQSGRQDRGDPHRDSHAREEG